MSNLNFGKNSQFTSDWIALSLDISSTLKDPKKIDIQELKKNIAEIMSKASEPEYKFSVPLTVDVQEGINWTAAH